MIKGIILDVDGVLVGEKTGFNFPDPHPDVIERLKDIEKKGISVCLCTAKPHFSIQKIINDAGLHSLHITNGGGVIIDPVDNIIFKSYFLDKDAAKAIVKTCLEKKIYVEIYSIDDYFIEQNQLSDFTHLHTEILQRQPVIVESLTRTIEQHDIVKIMPIVKDDLAMKNLDNILSSYQRIASISWGTHPVALPRRFGIITAKGISKKQAAIEIAAYEKIKPDELLGVGDNTSDWQFIEYCGFAGAMGNASEELKNLIETKGSEKYCIGKSVDENGILDIFTFFGI